MVLWATVEAVWEVVFWMAAELEEGEQYGLPRGITHTLRLMLQALLENRSVGTPIHKDAQALLYMLSALEYLSSEAPLT